MVEQFKIGDVVKLCNRDTVYGDNGIPEHHWDTEGVVVGIDDTWRHDGDSRCAYHIQFGDGFKCHVVHAMLAVGGGPW